MAAVTAAVGDMGGAPIAGGPLVGGTGIAGGGPFLTSKFLPCH